MTTNDFVVTYSTGAVATYQSTCASVEAFANEHFGSTWADAQENGATIAMNPDKPAETPAKKGKKTVHVASGAVSGQGAASTGG